MSIKTFIKNNTDSLFQKTVAVTGTTGGLGKELCLYLASLGASLILMDRNKARSEAFREEIIKKYPYISVKLISIDLSNIDSVKKATLELKEEKPDVFIHNAGAYSIPRSVCSTGLDNVFQINFASPYYIIREILPVLREKKGRAIAVSSIAHDYSKIDEKDIDFKTRNRASLVYGNAKMN